MADRSTDKSSKNKPDIKTTVISIVLLAAAAAMLIWLGVQLWSSHTLKQSYGDPSLTPLATAEAAPEPTPETELEQTPEAVSSEEPSDNSSPEAQTSEAPADDSQSPTPEPDYDKTFGLDT